MYSLTFAAKNIWTERRVQIALTPNALAEIKKLSNPPLLAYAATVERHEEAVKEITDRTKVNRFDEDVGKDDYNVQATRITNYAETHGKEKMKKLEELGINKADARLIVDALRDYMRLRKLAGAVEDAFAEFAVQYEYSTIENADTRDMGA